LNGKQNTLSNAAFLDATSSVQAQLNGKQATLSNASNLSKVDITSSLSNLLLNKWNVPYNELNLMNVDITSSLTSSLNSKANLNGSTYTGTHDFSSATVTGISSSPTITDGSLTIAKTSGLQTALDSKAERTVFTLVNLGVASTNAQVNLSASANVNKLTRLGCTQASSTTIVRLPANNTVQNGDMIALNWVSSAGSILMSVQQTDGVIIGSSGGSNIAGGSSRNYVYYSSLDSWLQV
jgi:hypothetical protein